MNEQEAQAYDEGFEAYGLGHDEDMNPYVKGTSLAHAWENGWDEAFEDMGE